MSDQSTPHHYSYHGPLGEVSHSGRYYFAWKEGFLIGTYNTFEEAIASLERTPKDPVGDGWAFLIFDIDCARFSDGLSQVIRKHLDPGPNDT